MPKRFFKKLAPDSDKIKKSKSLAWLGTALHHPWLWHFNRHSVAGAFAVGMFCMWIPFPPQTLMAASIAVLIRVNLPISVALVYVTNPITIPPLFYLAYQFGGWLLGENLQNIDFSLTAEWFQTTFMLIWPSMLLGCMIFAAASAVIGYYGIHLFWRLHIVQQIKDRRAKRRQKRKEDLEAALGNSESPGK